MKILENSSILIPILVISILFGIFMTYNYANFYNKFLDCSRNLYSCNNELTACKNNLSEYKSKINQYKNIYFENLRNLDCPILFIPSYELYSIDLDNNKKLEYNPTGIFKLGRISAEYCYIALYNYKNLSYWFSIKEKIDEKDLEKCYTYPPYRICWVVNNVFGILKIGPVGIDGEITFSLPSKDYIFFIECDGADAIPFCVGLI